MERPSKETVLKAMYSYVISCDKDIHVNRGTEFFNSLCIRWETAQLIADSFFDLVSQNQVLIWMNREYPHS